MGILRAMQRWHRAGNAWLKPPRGFGLLLAIVIGALAITGVAVTVPAAGLCGSTARALGYGRVPLYPMKDLRLLGAIFVVALIMSSVTVLLVHVAAGRVLHRLRQEPDNGR